jgi:dTDP-4-dehydrorhamnose reductase
MRVLLTGADGQLGRHLVQRCPDGIELIESSRNSEQWPCDLSERDQVLTLLDSARPRAIINAAAWTAVDAAEDHEAAADRLNADLPVWLGEWGEAHGAGLMSYSTDYVFDGEPGRGWVESDPCRPQSAYGRGKRRGEEGLLAHRGACLIVRTAWVYSALPGNFLTAILARAAAGQSLKVVDDQVGSPTWAGTLAEASWRMLERMDSIDRPTLMHVAGREAMSWYGFARRALDLAKSSVRIPESVQIEPIGSDAWPQRAKRPAWSVLDCSRYENWTGHHLPTTGEALKECMEQWATDHN